MATEHHDRERPIARPPFTDRATSPRRSGTARDDKAGFANTLLPFHRDATSARTLFTQRLVLPPRRMCFGHIAHTNQRGLLATSSSTTLQGKSRLSRTNARRALLRRSRLHLLRRRDGAIQARLRAASLLAAYRARRAAEIEGANAPCWPDCRPNTTASAAPQPVPPARHPMQPAVPPRPATAAKQRHAALTGSGSSGVPHRRRPPQGSARTRALPGFAGSALAPAGRMRPAGRVFPRKGRTKPLQQEPIMAELRSVDPTHADPQPAQPAHDTRPAGDGRPAARLDHTRSASSSRRVVTRSRRRHWSSSSPATAASRPRSPPASAASTCSCATPTRPPTPCARCRRT